MTEPIPSGGQILRIERHLPAPPEIVFARLTDPSSMARWLSPTGEAEVEADVRVMGRFTVVMLGEGTRLRHTGEYLAIEPPRKLSFTWISPYTGDEPSRVTIELEPSGRGTLLHLIHEHLPIDQMESHGRGWTSILDHLAAVLVPEAGRRDRP